MIVFPMMPVAESIPITVSTEIAVIALPTHHRRRVERVQQPHAPSATLTGANGRPACRAALTMHASSPSTPAGMTAAILRVHPGNSATTRIRPTIWQLKSVNSSAGTHNSTMLPPADPPASA